MINDWWIDPAELSKFRPAGSHITFSAFGPGFGRLCAGDLLATRSARFYVGWPQIARVGVEE